VKVALFWKAFILTLFGTLDTDGLLLISDTTIPREGAALLKTTVPVELVPPATLVGFRATETRLSAALAELVINTEEAITAVRTVITNIDLLCFHIFSSLEITSSFIFYSFFPFISRNFFS